MEEDASDEWVDLVSDAKVVDCGGGEGAYRAQMMLSAVSDCNLVSVLCCP